MYQSFPIDRQRGLISLATREAEGHDGAYVAFCTNHIRAGVSLHSNLDANQKFERSRRIVASAVRQSAAPSGYARARRQRHRV
jgi:hypothetical protein